MRILGLIGLLFFFYSSRLTAQLVVPDPGRIDFNGSLGFLSSDWMQGREAGTSGSFMAADYILSQMMQAGLDPGTGNPGCRHFFQDFDILRYQAVRTEFAIVEKRPGSVSRKSLTPETDFIIGSGPSGFQVEAPLLFAGYGITAPHLGYDDYRNISAAGSIVVVMDGFPGAKDAASSGAMMFGDAGNESFTSVEARLQNATEKGALAMILISPEGTVFSSESKPVNLHIAKSAFDRIHTASDEGYTDASYVLPDERGLIPLVRLGKEAVVELLKGSGIDPADVEKKMAGRVSANSLVINGKHVYLSAETKTEKIRVRNVIGHIRGLDTTRSIVIGAHYDHLGKRDQMIYNGSDDNASGVAGMLAIAKAWHRSGAKPPCNLIFAAWTAEEKGILGSTWFVRNHNHGIQQILLNVNFDMISRSAGSDTGSNIISIGVLKGTDHLKRMAEVSNSSLEHPLTLDLWETSGGGGSDYRPFAARNIPVMSFFSGFHDDYHTPRDIYARADLEKMESILKLANRILVNFLTSGKP